MERLTQSLSGRLDKGKPDNMIVDTMFSMIDIDRDGYIGIDDLLSMKQELGWDQEVNK